MQVFRDGAQLEALNFFRSYQQTLSALSTTCTTGACISTTLVANYVLQVRPCIILSELLKIVRNRHYSWKWSEDPKLQSWFWS